MFVSSFIHERTLKTILFHKKIELREKHVNRKSKSLEIKTDLYRCYEYEAPISCNTNLLLSQLIWCCLVIYQNCTTFINAQEQFICPLTSELGTILFCPLTGTKLILNYNYCVLFLISLVLFCYVPLMITGMLLIHSPCIHVKTNGNRWSSGFRSMGLKNCFSFVSSSLPQHF